MTGTLMRRSIQVAGLAAGILMFTGGVAQAADGVSTAPEGGHHGGNHSSVDLDQDAANVCGNIAFNSGVVFNGTDCDAVNLAAKKDGGHKYTGGKHGDDWSVDLNQDSANICGNIKANSGVIINGTDCDAVNLAAKGGGH